MTRRQAFWATTRAGYGALMGASPFLRGQTLAGEPPGRIPPVQDLVNSEEFAGIAQRKLDSLAYAEIAGGDRSAFERITFRPRLMVDSTKLDMTTSLFGQSLFAPILVGPTSQQKRFHPEGELAMARGACAAKAVMVVADHSSYPIHEIAQIFNQAKNPFWYQVYPEADMNQVRTRVQQAVSAGCKALCVTVGTVPQVGELTAGVPWSAIDRLRQGIGVPVLLKGVMSPEEAQKAVAAGVQGIVVSNYSGRPLTGIASAIEMLPSIAAAVGGKLPILIDGCFRRGSDVLKALALGAQAVLLGRPALWGLAAYGADGVQNVVELIQSELARDMAMCGKVNIKALDPSVVRIHRR
jgi:4-hydroxymandelate oxidase